MRKLLVILTIWLFALSTASAQDWRNDDDTNTRYDCEVIDTLIAEHGDELLFKYDDDSTLTLRGFMEALFAECQEPAASDTDAETRRRNRSARCRCRNGNRHPGR